MEEKNTQKIKYMERFQEIVSNKEWERVQPFFIEMEENGFSKEVSEISQIMTGSDTVEYKKWDEKVNGTMEVQMDDSDESMQMF